MADAARNITKVNLELGGKAPAIVADDADLDLAAATLKAGRVLNTGAACNAPERIYVDKKVAEEFVAKLTEQTQRLQIVHQRRSAFAG